MARRNPFEKVHYKKIVLNKQTEKEVENLYASAARDIKKRLKHLKIINPSDELKKIYLEDLLKEIKKSQAEFRAALNSTVVTAGERSGSLAIEAGNRWMKQAGLEIKGAYSYVPKREVQNIISGKLYGNNWSLSKAIWKNVNKTQSDIEKIVAKGLTENKPIKEIADALEKYVDPKAKKPWDWSKVYPGTSAKVDYNAQRLARTMIQHSYQQSLVQQQQYNPFCTGIMWHSEMIHGRTCELCEERDGQIFPVNDLPLDHPSGLCYFEPVLENMDAVADRLADWALGESDFEIDNYIAHAY